MPGAGLTIPGGLSSGAMPSAEAISGHRAVFCNQSGQIQIAMSSVSGRMPAIGVVIDSVVSGGLCNIYQNGFLQFAAGTTDFSGYVGTRAWVGRSGQITSLSGSWSSGGFGSGDIGQHLGQIVNSGAVLVNLNPSAWSGGPLGIPTGGPV
jgi:hypothetical protein